MYTEKDLKQIAVDLAEGKIFSNFHLRDQNDLTGTFMVMLFMEPDQLKKLADEEIMFIYEYMDKANPLSVNGMPTFFSMHYMNKYDFAIMYNEYQRYVKMRQEFLSDFQPFLPVNFGDSVLTEEDLNKYKSNS